MEEERIAVVAEWHFELDLDTCLYLEGLHLLLENTSDVAMGVVGVAEIEIE